MRMVICISGVGLTIMVISGGLNVYPSRGRTVLLNILKSRKQLRSGSRMLNGVKC